jgi:hypothetical protein
MVWVLLPRTLGRLALYGKRNEFYQLLGRETRLAARVCQVDPRSRIIQEEWQGWFDYREFRQIVLVRYSYRPDRMLPAPGCRHAG